MNFLRKLGRRLALVALFCVFTLVVRFLRLVVFG